MIFRSRLRIDTFPEDFAKSTESNFTRVFQDSFPMGVNEEFSLSSSLAAQIHSTDQSYSTEALRYIYVCMYICICRKLSRRGTSALHLRSFHADVGECVRE